MYSQLQSISLQAQQSRLSFLDPFSKFRLGRKVVFCNPHNGSLFPSIISLNCLDTTTVASSLFFKESGQNSGLLSLMHLRSYIAKNCSFHFHQVLGIHVGLFCRRKLFSEYSYIRLSADCLAMYLCSMIIGAARCKDCRG
jgi:hypothetical protein